MSAESLNVGICGHTDEGKSTLLGHLICQLNLVDDRELKQARELAISRHRDSTFTFAVLVSSEKALKRYDIRGVTVKTSRVVLSFDDRDVTMLDTPGHEDFMKNMIWGLHQADFAILLVSVDGRVQKQTIEVVNILRSFNIPLSAVVVNKMDKVDWMEGPFDKAREEVSLYLNAAGVVALEDMPWIPTAALAGEGLIDHEKISWYDGPSVADLIKGISASPIQVDGPMRLSFERDDVFDVKGIGEVAVGIVESGKLCVGDTIIFEPVSYMLNAIESSPVRSIQLARDAIGSQGVNVREAIPRQIVGVRLRKRKRGKWFDFFDSQQASGIVAGPPDNRPTVGTRFLCTITLVAPVGVHKHSLAVGQPFSLNCHGEQVNTRITRLRRRRRLDEPWGQEDGVSLSPNEQAEVEIETAHPIAIETSGIPSLSRFAIRVDRRVVGFGSITDVLD